jgi:hypothetical protein
LYFRIWIEAFRGVTSMAKIKYDGVVESVHYDPDGTINWVRVYQRRGPTFSDRMLLKRDDFINQLKGGKKYYSGKRIPFQGGTFEVFEPVRLLEKDGQEIVVIGEKDAEHDRLEGVPII